MKRFRLGAKLQYQVFQPATFLFNVAVAPNSQQKILFEQLRLTPTTNVDEHVSQPLLSRYHRTHIAEAGTFELNYQADVELLPTRAADTASGEVSHAVLPQEVMPYIYPSRYCESDRLSRLAMLEFGNLSPGYRRVQGISDWIYHNVLYLSGSTSSNTSAFNTVTERAGVCRDFAHLGITFCRALGIPARFVTGYVAGLNPPDFHATFEAYLDNGWYLFDATRLVSLADFVRVGTGHDAADVAFATIFGAVEMTNMTLTVEALSSC